MRAWRCNHSLDAKKEKRNTCSNCGKRIEWASINNSEKIGFWIHAASNMEECVGTVATPSGGARKKACYHQRVKVTA